MTMLSNAASWLKGSQKGRRRSTGVDQEQHSMLLLLEPRLVFDAAIAATAADVVDKTQQQVVAERGCDVATKDAPASRTTAQAAPEAAPQPAVRDVPAAQPVTTVVFIDARVADAQNLLNELAPGTEGHIIAANQDGASVIAQTLAGRHDIASVQIFSHGAPGMLTLGTSHMDAASLEGSQGEIVRSWSSALTANADILIYGCSVGQGTEGRLFVDRLAQVTGADVAASVDDVGGGHGFSLETTHGTIEAKCALSDTAMATYASDLASTPVISDYATVIRTGAEDSSFVLGSNLALSDADSSSLTVTLNVSHGLLSINDATGLTLSGNGSRSVTLSGDVARINTAVQGLTYRGDANFSGADSLAITARDSTNLTSTRNVGFTVTPVNDAPVFSTPSSPITVKGLTGGSAFLSDAGLGLSDVDSDASTRTVIITSLPTNGYLELNGAKLGVGSGFSGTQLANVKYIYMPADPTSSPTADSFGVLVDDGQGASASGNVGVRINVAPTVTAQLWVSEGQADVPVSIRIVDPDQGSGTAYTITILSLPTEGTLKLNGTAVSTGQSFSSTQLSQLTYSHSGVETDRNSPPSFTFQVTDDGRGVTSAKASVDTRLDIAVVNNDRDPTLDINAGMTLSGTGAGSNIVAFTSSMLKVSDVDSTAGSLVFTLGSAPTKGRLLLKESVYDSVAQAYVLKEFSLREGASFSMNDIYTGKLRYEYTDAATGAQSDTFSFTVKDGALHTTTSLNADGTYSVATTPGGIAGSHTFAISVGSTVLRTTPLTGMIERSGNQAPQAHPTQFNGLNPVVDANNKEVTIRETGWKF